MIKMYFLLALFTLIATAESQKYQQQQQQDGNNDAGSGERVDKLASASGDLYWRPQQILSPPDWYQNALMNKLQEQQQQQQQQQQYEIALILYIDMPGSGRKHHRVICTLKVEQWTATLGAGWLWHPLYLKRIRRYA